MNKPLLALALCLVAGSVQAGSDDSDTISLKPDQTLRLKVMAQADVAGPCRVLLGFLDHDGKLMGNAAGRELSKRISLQPGQTETLEIRGRDFAADQRTELLPAVQVEPDHGARNQCPGVMVSVEVLDRKSGQNIAALGDSAVY